MSPCSNAGLQTTDRGADESVPSTGNPPGGSSSGAPVDGGAILLVASAAAYGYKKLKERKPEKSE